MSLRTRILLYSVLFFAVLAIVQGINYLAFQRMGDQLSGGLKRTAQATITAEQLDADLVHYDSAALRYLITGEQPWLDETQTVRARVLNRLTNLRHAQPSGTAAHDLAVRIDSLTKRYFASTEPLLYARNPATVRRFLGVYNEQLVPLVNQSHTLSQTYRETLYGTIQASINESRRRTNYGILVLSIIAPLAALWGVMLHFGLSRPLTELLVGVRQIASGNLGLRLPVTGNDEVGQLAQAFNRMATEVQQERHKLIEQAVTDEKTKLFNFRYFTNLLRDELARAKRFGHPLSLIMLDVDNFKHYNDTNGHLLGDEVLIGVARLLRTAGRETDVVARYGGEEFAVVLPETDKPHAITVAERLRRAIEMEPFPNGEKQPLGRVSISLGVSTFPFDAEFPQDLIDTADSALYQAKETGRNRVVFYVPDPQQKPG